MDTLIKRKNFKTASMQLAKQTLANGMFISGVHEYINQKPFREFKNKNEQFLYERGRQFAAHLTHLGYDGNLVKNNVNWLDKELITAVKTKALI